MKLSLSSIDSAAELEQFIARPEYASIAKFYHTYAWGEVQREQGYPVHRLGAYDAGELLAVMTVVQMRDRFGAYAYVPRGPVMDYGNHGLVQAVLEALIDYVRVTLPQMAFVRIDPALPHDAADTEQFAKLGFKRAGKFTQVERAWIIEIGGKSDEQQLEWMKDHDMRSNVPRYLRRAERMGVTIRSSTDAADMETFLTMSQALDNRKGGIGLLPLDYYRRQLQFMAPHGYERLFIAEFEGKPVASALIAFYGEEASYLHGASYNEFSQLHAPHLMHWEIMKYARAHGCLRYNMWGVVKDEHHHPGYRGYGFSEFKRSFGGMVELYMRGQDYPLKGLRYRLTNYNDKRRLKKFQME